MRGISVVIGLVLFMLCGPAQADWTIKNMNAQIDQTNFLVNDNCSATLINKDKGLLLTASHCIESQYKEIERQKIDDKGVVTTEKVRVSTPGIVSQLFFKGTAEISRVAYVFKIVKSGSADSGLDLAVIQVLGKLPNTIDAKIACVEPERGDTSYAVGNPRGVFYASISKGIIASINRNYRMLGLDRDEGLIHSTAAIGGGSSGGALYNDEGQIVGVVVRGTQTIAPIGFSVPLSDIKGFLKGTEAESAMLCPDAPTPVPGAAPANE